MGPWFLHRSTFSHLVIPFSSQLWSLSRHDRNSEIWGRKVWDDIFDSCIFTHNQLLPLDPKPSGWFRARSLCWNESSEPGWNARTSWLEGRSMSWMGLGGFWSISESVGGFKNSGSSAKSMSWMGLKFKLHYEQFWHPRAKFKVYSRLTQVYGSLIQYYWFSLPF